MPGSVLDATIDRIVFRSALLLFVFPLIAACVAPRAAPRAQPLPPAPSAPIVRDQIEICGERFSIGTPVVLWRQPPNYDARSTKPRFAPVADGPLDGTLRYRPGRSRTLPDGTRETLIEPHSTDLDALRAVVDQFVIHYDACWTSEQCFRVLHDQRGLSVHFLLDVDGTIYQTLDLRDQASHATKANPRSIGIEIANLGAFRAGTGTVLDKAYLHDTAGPYLALPASLEGGGVRTRGFVPRPARPERVRGTIQGGDLEQHDLTNEQYDALVKLTAGLCRVFPKITPEVPRDASGAVETKVLDDARYEEFHGILGHYHVQANKTDPGPAFDWERFLARVREELGPASP
jgi:N-acetylmuramoyl-L-alanine amidase